MRHPEFPVVSFLSILLLGCSLPSHIRARSVCTLALLAWLAVMSLIRGVNALIWANNFVVRLEVWCDIVTKIPIGFTYAVPASALCILRHLESVASSRQVLSTAADKRWRQKFEAFMCFGIPFLGMALHYVVQGHRFDLFEDVGCAPTAYFSVAAVIILWVPPLVMSLITFGYAAMTIKHFLRHRIEFTAHLRNSQSAISPGRYFRLMALALFEMIWDTGVNAYILYFNTFTGLRPWINWDNVHSNFSRVQVFPRAMIPPMFMTQVIWQWWIVPVSCICFFIFFAFGEEAMADYRAAFLWFRRNLLRQTIETHHSFNISTLPTYRQRHLDSHNIDVFPGVTEDTSKREAKPWDELSLKMPQTKEFIISPSLVDSAQSTRATRHISLHSLSLDDKHHTTSIHTLESSSSTAAGSWARSPSPMHDRVASIQSPNITHSDSDVSSPSSTNFSHSSLTDRTLPTHSTHRTSSFALSHPSGDHGEVTISTAYFPDSGAAA